VHSNAEAVQYPKSADLLWYLRRLPETLTQTRRCKGSLLLPISKGSLPLSIGMPRGDKLGQPQVVFCVGIGFIRRIAGRIKLKKVN